MHVGMEREFYTAIAASAKTIANAFHTIRSEQSKVQSVVASYAGAWEGALDDYSVYLFGQAGETTLKLQKVWRDIEPVFTSIQVLCRQRMEKSFDLRAALQKKKIALESRQHYLVKVQTLSSGDRLQRNQEKLAFAEQSVNYSSTMVQDQVKELQQSHGSIMRLTAVRLCDALMGLLHHWGDAVSSWDSGLRVGSKVRIVGDRKTYTLSNIGSSVASVGNKVLPSTLFTPISWALPEPTEPTEATNANEERRKSLPVEECDPNTKFSITPNRVRRGHEETLIITSPPLAAPIVDVAIDGVKMAVVSGERHRVVCCGVLDHVTRGVIELMAEGYHNLYTREEVHLVVYDLNRFYPSPVGNNIQLSDDRRSACRTEASVNGITFLSLTKPFFEIEIGEVVRKGQTRGPAFGFMAASVAHKLKLLPTVAGDLNYAMVVGGDLPHLMLNAEKQNRIQWRPRNDLNDGDKVQVLLTRRALKIFHNGKEEVALDLPHQVWLNEPLVGIVDIAGSLKKVTIVDGSEPLATPLFGEEELPVATVAEKDEDELGAEKGEEEELGAEKGEEENIKSPGD